LRNNGASLVNKCAHRVFARLAKSAPAKNNATLLISRAEQNHGSDKEGKGNKEGGYGNGRQRTSEKAKGWRGKARREGPSSRARARILETLDPICLQLALASQPLRD
jgi:hypothetical protein